MSKIAAIVNGIGLLKGLIGLSKEIQESEPEPLETSLSVYPGNGIQFEEWISMNAGTAVTTGDSKLVLYVDPRGIVIGAKVRWPKGMYYYTVLQS